MNPYHRLYDYLKENYYKDETYPFCFNGPGPGDYAGQTARAVIYIEGERFEFAVSVEE